MLILCIIYSKESLKDAIYTYFEEFGSDQEFQEN